MVTILALILWIAIGVVISKIIGVYTTSSVNRYGGSFLATALIFGSAAGTHSYYMKHKKEQEAYLAGFGNLEDYEAARSKGFETKSALDAYESEKKKTVREARLEKQAEEKEKFKQKRAEEKANCQKSPACWADKHLLDAGFACVNRIEKSSNYAFEWKEERLGNKFTLFKLKNDGNIITYIGDEIKFQNKFGAWQNYIYSCDFDITKKTVVDLRLDPGHLP